MRLCICVCACVLVVVLHVCVCVCVCFWATSVNFTAISTYLSSAGEEHILITGRGTRGDLAKHWFVALLFTSFVAVRVDSIV